jgi:polyphosphate glucokinase
MMINLGIDIGGSGIKGAPVDIQIGELTSPRFRIPTPNHARPEDVAQCVKEIVKHFDWTGNIGCGFPAIIRSGVAYSAANVDPSWIGTDIDKLFTEATGCSTKTINDADAAGLAEMSFGAGKDWQKGVVFLITVGTGIGTAVFVDGHLLPNTEFGHIEIRGKDAEWRASDAARQRKDLSWEKWGKRLNEYLQTMEKLIWPDVVILGGGASKDFEKFVGQIKLNCEVIPAKLLNTAGIVGAALSA